MWALPHDTRLTHRRIDKPLREWMQRIVPAWERDKIYVTITQKAEKTTWEQPVFRADLERGDVEMLPRFDHRRTYAPVEQGEALIRFEREAGLAGSDVMIFVHTFSSMFDVQDELEVARDAYLAGDPTTGMRIARRALPHGFALFDVIVRLEAKHLGKL